MSIFFANSERTLSAYFQFAQMDLARAALVLIRVLRTFINSIAKNLHKLQICLRFYFFYKNSTFRLLKNISHFAFCFFCGKDCKGARSALRNKTKFFGAMEAEAGTLKSLVLVGEPSEPTKSHPKYITSLAKMVQISNST